MSDEQHLALPQLYGGPAYSRPARPVEEIPRPFDPDELPLEAERSDEDAAWADQLMGNDWTPTPASAAPPRASPRARGAKSGKSGAAGQAGAPSAASTNGRGGLQGRPFRLRGLGRIFRSDHK